MDEKRVGGLPEPDAAARAHSRRLFERIADEIALSDDGRIGFARYMDLALHAPGLGYYSAGTAKFGADGDYTTAAEFSRAYAGCIARHCAAVLAETGGGILEVGAGTGRMALGVLETLAGLDRLPARYEILELSADLRDRQRRLLSEALPAGIMARVHWRETLPEPPFDGLVIANELLDALPVHCFRKSGGHWRERCVTVADSRLVDDERPIRDARLASAIEGIVATVDPLPEGYLLEIGLAARDWITTLAGTLGRAQLLIIDYGYPRREFYHPQRVTGTLVCYYRHRCHDDPLLLPGLQDITAHVDFTALAETGRAAGLDCRGFTTQASFLLSAGLLEHVSEEAVARDPALSRELQTLLMPGSMGETFKVMALSRGLEDAGPGFAMRDERHRL